MKRARSSMSKDRDESRGLVALPDGLACLALSFCKLAEYGVLYCVSKRFRAFVVHALTHAKEIYTSDWSDDAHPDASHMAWSLLCRHAQSIQILDLSDIEETYPASLERVRCELPDLVLQNAHCLRQVYLAEDVESGAFYFALARCKNLSRLHAYGSRNKVRDSDMERALQHLATHCKGLNTLFAFLGGRNDADADADDDDATRISLETLLLLVSSSRESLQEINIDDVPASAMASLLLGCDNLTQVNLSCTGPVRATYEALSSCMRTLPALETLELNLDSLDAETREAAASNSASEALSWHFPALCTLIFTHSGKFSLPRLVAPLLVEFSAVSLSLEDLCSLLRSSSKLATLTCERLFLQDPANRGKGTLSAAIRAAPTTSMQSLTLRRLCLSAPTLRVIAASWPLLRELKIRVESTFSLSNLVVLMRLYAQTLARLTVTCRGDEMPGVTASTSPDATGTAVEMQRLVALKLESSENVLFRSLHYPVLKTLHLAGKHTRVTDLAQVFQSCPKLESLVLSLHENAYCNQPPWNATATAATATATRNTPCLSDVHALVASSGQFVRDKNGRGFENVGDVCPSRLPLGQSIWASSVRHLTLREMLGRSLVCTTALDERMRPQHSGTRLQSLLAWCPSLKALLLENCACIREFMDWMRPSLRALPQLRALDFSLCQGLSDGSIARNFDAFSFFNACTQVERIELPDISRGLFQKLQASSFSRKFK